MTYKDKQRSKRKLIMYLWLGYISVGTMFAAFILTLVSQFQKEEMDLLGKILLGAMMLFGALSLIFYVMSTIYHNRLRIYEKIIQLIRSKHNFKVGMDYIEADDFDKAVDVVNTINDRDARLFYYHTVLYMGLNSKNKEVRIAHKNHINEKIQKYTTWAN